MKNFRQLLLILAILVVSVRPGIAQSTGSDSVGFIADTILPKITGANLFLNEYFPQDIESGTGGVLDEAVDRANERLYVLTADQELNTYDIVTSTENGYTAPTGLLILNSIVHLNFPGKHIALSLDGRTGYIGSTGQVTAINLYPEYDYWVNPQYGLFSRSGEAVYWPAHSYQRTYPLPKGVYQSRDVAAMAVHPAGDRLYVFIDMDPNFKSLNINNGLLPSDLGNGLTAAQLPGALNSISDYGFLTYLDISPDLKVSEPNQPPAQFVTPFDIKKNLPGTAFIGVRKIAFSPDGNYALICAVGAQSPRVTPFGVMPTSDVGTGGTLVVDVRRYSDASIPTPPTALTNAYLGFIPDTEHGENTAKLRQEILDKGATIIHPDVVTLGITPVVAGAGYVGIEVIGAVASPVGAAGSLFGLPDAADLFDEADLNFDMLWKSYQDYGYMDAYYQLYPRDMVGASSVAINHVGNFGVVTMQDTNNLGLLNLSISDNDVEGYRPGYTPVDGDGNFGFYIAQGTGRTINGFDEALGGFLSTAEAPQTKTFSEWAYPQTVAFTSDDSRIFIGMANGGPTPNKTNQAGTADARALQYQVGLGPNSVFLSNSPPPGYVLAGNGGFESPRMVATLQSFASTSDSLSDQVKAYNRWNSLRPESQIDPHFADNEIVSMDSAHLTIPGTYFVSDPKIPNAGFFLPPSGAGYRLNTYGMPTDTTSLATRDVVTSLEQIGLLWSQLYYNPGNDRAPGSRPVPANMPSITRPYFIIGLLSQPGGGIINRKGQNPEPITGMSGDGNEADLPYLKLNSDGTFSDEAFNFLYSNGPNSPTTNTGKTNPAYFDHKNMEALIRLLLSDPNVTKIELDPAVITFLPADIRSDLLFSPHGSLTEPNSRRDMSNHMHVTFK